MYIENFLKEHHMWLDLFTAVGTVGATVTALFIAIRTELASRSEILSGLAIVDVDPNGNAYLTNTTKRALQFSVYKNENFPYCQGLKTSELRSAIWISWKDKMVLSPGERIVLHLKSLVAENTLVEYAGVKVVLKRRTRYWVFRYAGVKARDSAQLRDDTHPHLSWVLEFSMVD